MFFLSLQQLTHRVLLDRRRVEDAYFQYAILKVSSWYPEKFSLCKLPLHHNTQSTILDVTTVYHGLFIDTYASKFTQ